MTLVSAAVVAVVVIAVALSLLLGGSSAKVVPVTVAPTASVGGFPTGVAVDPTTDTVYVASGVSGSLSIIDARRCNASTSAGCVSAKTVSTGGQDAIGVVVDEQTRTVYAVNGGSDTVAVIDARTCNAIDTSGCSKAPALVNVSGGPEFLAVNEKTDTVYVADTGSGTVSVIDGTTCNASDTSGCAKAPATVSVGQGAFPVAVDEDTNTVYVGTLGEPGGPDRGNVTGAVYVIDGRRCDSAVTAGCAAAPKSVRVGAEPAGIAVDSGSGTVYVSSESGTIAVIDAKTCNGSESSGCSVLPRLVPVQSDPRGNALDVANDTLYATNAGSNTLSMLDTSSCNARNESGCGKPALTVPVGGSPRRVAIDPATSSAYVVNVEDSTVSIINTKHCYRATDMPRLARRGRRFRRRRPRWQSGVREAEHRGPRDVELVLFAGDGCVGLRGPGMTALTSCGAKRVAKRDDRRESVRASWSEGRRDGGRRPTRSRTAEFGLRRPCVWALRAAIRTRPSWNSSTRVRPGSSTA